MPTEYEWNLTSGSLGSPTETDLTTPRDFLLTWDPTRGAADLSIAANDLARSGGLETAVYLSLFLDRRADDGDQLPDGEGNRRGWWGDAHPVADGDRIGSRLWLLARAKQTPDVLSRAQQYAREALQWMIDDRVTDRIDVSAEFVRSGILGIAVTIHRPTSNAVTYRYNYNWASQEARSA